MEINDIISKYDNKDFIYEERKVHVRVYKTKTSAIIVFYDDKGNIIRSFSLYDALRYNVFGKLKEVE